MNQVMSLTNDAVSPLVRTLQARPNLAPMAKRALRYLEQHPWPAKGSETWKYSSPTVFLEREWKLDRAQADAATLLSPTNLAFVREVQKWAHVILIAGGTFKIFGELPTGITIRSVAAEHVSASEILSEERFEGPSQAGALPSHIEVLNRALAQQVFQVEISEDAIKPLALLIPTENEDALGVDVRIRVGPGKKATVFEWIGSTSGVEQSLINAHFNYNVEDGAELQIARLQNADQKAVVLTATDAHVGAKARIQFFQADFGQAWSRQEWSGALSKQNAHIDLYGLMFASIGRHIDHQTRIEHIVGETTSKQVYKAVLNERSRAVFNGKIVIPKHAQKSNSQMLNKNLLLSRKCEIDTKPELIVSANDVKAAHGCTVGQLNTEELFYLESRGLSPDQSRALLARGFAADVIYGIDNQNIQTLILSELNQALAVQSEFV